MSKDGKILGFNTRWLPSMYSELNRRVGYCVVLVAGAVGDYAAYAGFVREEQPTIDELDFIRRQGDKIRFEEAAIHFPSGQLQREKYRE